MRKVFIFMVIALCLMSCSRVRNLKFLQLNIWQEGTMVKGGYEAIVDELARADADFVMLSEVRNYDGSRFCNRITTSLGEKGKKYYSFYSYDSGLLSKYPIKDSVTIFPENGDHGSIYKLVADVSGREVVVYTAHLDYLNCAYYDVKGYDGLDWHKLDEPLTDKEKILEKNIASEREDAIKLFIEDAEKEISRRRLVFIGGDFNEPSYLDWIEGTKEIADHHGVVIPWTVTTMLSQNGYLDAYRTVYPNPLTHPGYTYPADCESVPVEKLTWAAESDERERIDFIFYYPDRKLKIKSASILGPAGCIVRSQRKPENSADPIITPIGIWPTDHKGIMAEFELTR